MNSTMSKRTVLNEIYKGLVESMSIPAELHERDGKKFASFGSVVPIHCCIPEEIKERTRTTHHYCDIFTDQLLAPLGELAYVRIDETTAEKVFVNRSKRILIVSSDGCLAQWRCAPTFESANHYIAGTPIVNKEGVLVSVVTAKRGSHYAVSTLEGEGGYFESSLPWEKIHPMDGELVYGDQTFSSRDALLQHLADLSPAEVSKELPVRPVLSTGMIPRLALITHSGRQLAHYYLNGVHASDVQYL
ncbi:poxin-like isoform X2 [Battus philenor]|uniref:poxin-like isoform X2 n=1 Tax=Battus philenor TaxID=42288 RepID=UPI0035D0EFA8